MGYKKQVPMNSLALLCVAVVVSSISMQEEMLLGVNAAGIDDHKPLAMYVFGDSTLDVGNNNYLPGKEVFRAIRPYNGIDFPGFPTGRYSNGYNTADYVAKSTGFANSPLPYLSLLAQKNSSQQDDDLALIALCTGVSYASGGAGILDSTNAGDTIPLWKQVQYFNATKARMVAFTAARGNSSGAVVDALLAESVFLIGIGTNDMIVFAEQQHNRSGADNWDDMLLVDELYTNLVSNYSAAISELYRLGARKFAIINVGMLGCAPVERLRNINPAETKAATTCWEGLNNLTAGFNDKLASLLLELEKSRPGLAYSLGDSYSLSIDTLADPWAVGFTHVASACCGSGQLNAEGTCRPGSSLCANRDHYIYWDGLHVTQRTSFLTVKAFYNGPAQYTKPINFKQLAHTNASASAFAYAYACTHLN